MNILFLPGWTDGKLSLPYVNEMTMLELAMKSFFESKEYGLGVKEMRCIVNCFEHDENDERYFQECKYNSRGKRIECTIDMNYKISSEMQTRGEFVKYMKNKHLDNAMQVVELTIAKFDANMFMKDLEIFFLDYINEHKDLDGKLWE